LISVISVEEQLSGWYTRLRRAKSIPELAEAYRKLTETVQVLARFDLLSCSETAIRRFLSLKALKIGVGSWDLRIAAIALEEDAIVVTRNHRDFQLVPGLRCEDWSA
jgi:tRNA(fMet)-specific endonuclease VapC